MTFLGFFDLGQMMTFLPILAQGIEALRQGQGWVRHRGGGGGECS
jgi:hypothetical protein